MWFKVALTSLHSPGYPPKCPRAGITGEIHHTQLLSEFLLLLIILRQGLIELRLALNSVDSLLPLWLNLTQDLASDKQKALLQTASTPVYSPKP